MLNVIAIQFCHSSSVPSDDTAFYTCYGGMFCDQVMRVLLIPSTGILTVFNGYLYALQGLFLGAHPGMDPLALTKSSGIVPRVASCSGNPNPCALNSTSA